MAMATLAAHKSDVGLYLQVGIHSKEGRRRRMPCGLALLAAFDDMIRVFGLHPTWKTLPYDKYVNCEEHSSSFGEAKASYQQQQQGD